MTTMITELDEVTEAWLSSVIRQPVKIVARRSNPAFKSNIIHLTVRSPTPTVPEQLIVKLNADGMGEFEIKFYQLMAAQSEPLPILPPTLACNYIDGQSYLVQADLSATHRTPITRDDVLAGRTMPTNEDLRLMTTALAQLHAYWWEHPDLRTGTIPVRPWYGNLAEYRTHIQRREGEWGAFKQQVEDFPAELRQLYEDVLARLPQLWKRYLEPRITTLRNLTMSNGDSYFAQFLCPLPEAAGQHAYLVDFQEASVNFAAFDLVFMFAVFWTPQQRHANERETRLLRHYHDTLIQHGVTGYSWDQLWEDYRFMLALILFFPLFDAVSGASQHYWWTKMQCVVANFRDLDCMALFE